MKNVIQSAIRQVLVDRVVMLIISAIILGGVGYIVYVAVNLSASDLQLAIRYTTFGETHYYRDKWWYLLSFIGFGVLFIIAHAGMVIKLSTIGLRQLAIAFGWLSFIVLALMLVYTHSVLGIAYLN